MVFCDYASDLIRIPFKVKECSNYRDRTSPDWEQMEKLAIDLKPEVSLGKAAGFRLVSDTEQDEAVADAEVVSVE